MKKTRLLSWILVGVMVAGEAATPLASAAAQVNIGAELETYTQTEEEKAGETEAQEAETESVVLTAETEAKIAGEAEDAEKAQGTKETEDAESTKIAANGTTVLYSGTEENLNWSITSDGELRIEGTGNYGNAEWRNYSSYITSAVVNVTGITNTSEMFQGCSNITTMDLSGLDTKNVRTMARMFSGCNSLSELDLSGFNTENVMDMTEMFSGCWALTALDLSSFHTENVLYMTAMFSGDEKLAYIELNNFDTSNVLSLSCMFECCRALDNLDVSHFDTANAEKLSYMFYECASLTNLDVSGFDTRNVTNLSYMFCGCSKLEALDVSGFDTGNVTNMSDMFFGCGSLQELDVSGFDTENVTNMQYMFTGCRGVKELDVTNFNTANVTDMGGLFNGCSSVTELDVSGFDTANATCMALMFYDCANLESIDVSGFDTSEVEDMLGMFAGCEKLKELDLSSFNTANVIYMGEMFRDCQSLTSLDVSGFDTANVVDMDEMFSGCQSLTELDVSSFDTANVTGVSEMFSGCQSLTALDLSSFETENVTTAYLMVSECQNLSELIIPANFLPNSEEDVYLPISDNSYWKNDSGSICTFISRGISTVVKYTKYISEGKFDLSEAEAVLEKSVYIYDGASKHPAVTVTIAGKTLEEGTDYIVSYANNINPGTAIMVIMGMGDYEGAITLNFEIRLATCSVSYINNTMDGFKVVWNKVTGATGYYIYRRNDDGTYSSTPTATVTGESTTEWTDPLVLTGGKDYTYKVAAYYKSSDGTIIVGSSGTTKTCKYLKGGEVESVTNTTSGLKVTWTKVAGANGYYIFRKAAGESDYTQVATVSGSSKVSWTDTSSLTSGKNYTYKVSAIFTNSKGQVTKGGAKTTKTAKYLTAGKISSLSNTSSGVYIKWSKVTGATGYYVYRKASSASSYTLVKTITSVGTVSYTDAAVVNSNNVTCTYYIQPYFKSSAGVITKAGYTTKTIVRLTAPIISSLTNSSAKTLTVKWKTKSGVTGYQVQYSTSSSFASGNKTLTVTGASSSGRTVSGLTKGKTYYVRIRTYKTVNGTTYYSAWSTVKSVKISK